MKNVAISFSETIKSSAPLFTVIIAYIILGNVQMFNLFKFLLLNVCSYTCSMCTFAKCTMCYSP